MDPTPSDDQSTIARQTRLDNDRIIGEQVIAHRADYKHSLSSWLQDIPPGYYANLIEAMRLRGYCLTDRVTYEPVAPRSVSLSSRHPEVAPRAESLPSGDHVGEAVDEDEDAIVPANLPANVRLGGSVRRTVHGPRLGFLMGPVPVPIQEDLCRFWIERRTGIELDPQRPLADALVSGFLLCHLLDTEPKSHPPLVNLPWRIGEKNIAHFLRVAARKGFNRGELFDPQDLLYRRNIPRVLRTIAAIARKTDPEGFGAVAADLPGSRLQWTQADEPDEFWDGDWMIARLVKTFQRFCWRGRMNMVVVGSQGSGKSATVDTIVGRHFMEPSHNLRFIPHDSCFGEKEQQVIQDFRRAATRFWPHPMFERDTATFADETCRMYVKKSGVSVQIIEVPSMELLIERSEVNGVLMRSMAGRYEKVLEDLEDDEVDLCLLVERLDDYSVDRLTAAYRKLHRLFGDNVWMRTVAVLTHGCSLPPVGVPYDEFVLEKIDSVEKIARRVSGESAAKMTVVVMENSRSCPLDPSMGRPMLPNGSDFQLKLLEALELVLAKLQGSDPLKRTRVRAWWENYALAAAVFVLLSRL